MSHDDASELAQRLSLFIGMIMEDEVDGAVTMTPAAPPQLASRIERLREAGLDIAALASAADVVLRRYSRSTRDSAVGESK